jgi:hypothetical protein
MADSRREMIFLHAQHGMDDACQHQEGSAGQ